jgi:HPt (histidine-containing phosphotransfer) domain-containing protein
MSLESDEEDDVVQITPPSFRLQTKIGGSAGKIISPLAIQKAQKALADVMPPLTDEVGRLMKELEQAVRRRDANARDVIWNNAHEIRGLAGTAGKKSLGMAADLMCRYLNGSDSSFQADPTVLSTIAIVAMQAVKEGADEDPMVKMLLTDSAKAVIVQRRREGRVDSD